MPVSAADIRRSGVANPSARTKTKPPYGVVFWYFLLHTRVFFIFLLYIKKICAIMIIGVLLIFDFFALFTDFFA